MGMLRGRRERTIDCAMGRMLDKIDAAYSVTLWACETGREIDIAAMHANRARSLVYDKADRIRERWHEIVRKSA